MPSWPLGSQGKKNSRFITLLDRDGPQELLPKILEFSTQKKSEVGEVSRRSHRTVASNVVLMARHAPWDTRDRVLLAVELHLHHTLSVGLAVQHGHSVIFAKRCFFESGGCPGPQSPFSSEPVFCLPFFDAQPTVLWSVMMTQSGRRGCGKDAW